MLQSLIMTKQNVKFTQALFDKKGRKEKGLFLVEGEKSIVELATSSFEIKNLYITKEVFEKNKSQLERVRSVIEFVEAGELAAITTLEYNDTGVAIVKQKENTIFEIESDEMILALDTIRDPGNLGTIIRTADWYGITKIVCSKETAEFYNPKVIAASMGSFTRVEIFYTDLKDFLKEASIPIVGALLTGENAHVFDFPVGGILLLGNESNGIQTSLLPLITHPVTIPRYGRAESLNVAQATAILLDNWKRNTK